MAKNVVQTCFKKVGGWGGQRSGAGRPNNTGEVGHGRRPLVKVSTPLHVTWRLKVKNLNLRSRFVAEVFRRSAHGSKKMGLRILHYSIQGNHIHLMVEASDNAALARGLKSFAVRFVKGLRSIRKGQGSLFSSRYHLHVLKTPTEVKRALAYILQNVSNHSKLIWHIDEYSSASYFGKWRALLNRDPGPLLKGFDGPKVLPFYLSRPRSWLARDGWMRARG